MIAETTATLSTFLQDLIIPLQENFPKKHVLSDELTRNTKRSNFSGLQVRVPFLLNPKQGTGALSQTATLNTAKTLDDNAAFIAMGRVAHPIELSMDLIQAVNARDFVYAGDALKLHMAQAENALGRVENEFFCGDGSALIAAVTSDSTNTNVVTIGTTANFYQTYVNRIVDVVNRASGTSIYTSLSITAVGTNSVTLSSNVTVVSTQGLYVEGSYGNAIQGLRQPDATSGTFQGINLANVPGFRVTDGRGGSASAVDLSTAIMDGAYRRVNQATGRTPDFWVGDPAAIDKFGQGLVSQFHWIPKLVTLSTGWQGIEHRGVPLIPEFDMPFGYVLGVNKDAVSLYGYTSGPDWDDQTGSRFQRFARSLPVESWLVDYVQLGIHAPNMLVKIANLNEAS